MTLHTNDSGRDFDRSYKRGAVMGLTVAEAFILLAFCLLLLFTWWQLDTESKSLLAADKIGMLTAEEKTVIIAGLSDGSFKDYSRFVREEDLKRIMKGVVKLSPETRLSLSEAVNAPSEATLRTALSQAQSGDSTVDTISGRLEAAAKDQGDMVSLLNQRLGGSIRAAGGSIDAQGTITLPDRVLFDPGKDLVKNPTFLSEFCSSWLNALSGSGFDLSELKIEGHASSEWESGATDAAAYLNNLDLSQRRAKNALNHCLEGVTETETLSWARQHLAAIGYSSSRLILNPDGSEDRDASRRVMFSVSLNQEGLIEDIKRDVAPEAAPKEVAMEAEGQARVIDGDTLEINGTSYRLSGIDAPEAGQPCKAASGLAFDCGEVARRGLEKAIGSATVTCKAETIDFFQRPVALCKSGDTDLAALMVVNGFAVPFIEYSDAYASLGDTAMKNKVGIWATTFENPAEYRKKH